jgi:hypothetical protein
METVKTYIVAVMNTMDTVEVCGVENMRKFLLCYDTLEHVAEQLEDQSELLTESVKEES